MADPNKTHKAAPPRSWATNSRQHSKPPPKAINASIDRNRRTPSNLPSSYKNFRSPPKIPPSQSADTPPPNMHQKSPPRSPPKAMNSHSKGRKKFGAAVPRFGNSYDGSQSQSDSELDG